MNNEWTTRRRACRANRTSSTCSTGGRRGRGFCSTSLDEGLWSFERPLGAFPSDSARGGLERRKTTTFAGPKNVPNLCDIQAHDSEEGLRNCRLGGSPGFTSQPTHPSFSCFAKLVSRDIPLRAVSQDSRDETSDFVKAPMRWRGVSHEPTKMIWSRWRGQSGTNGASRPRLPRWDVRWSPLTSAYVEDDS